MENPVFTRETRARFVVLAGTLSDLSVLDFSKVNIQCLRIDSKELEEITEKLSNGILDKGNRTWNTLQKINSEFKDKLTDLYVLLPKDFSIEVKLNDFYSCWSVLLLIFPSDLSIYRIITFQLFDDKYLWHTSVEHHNFFATGDSTHDNYLSYDDNRIIEVNNFINIFFERINSIEFIKASLQSYVSSFSEIQPTMSYLSLCISLESIVTGNAELSYRIRRNVAILCAKEPERAEKIFDNLGRIYELRSKIVHAAKFKQEKIEEYLPYLRSVISRMIIEVILINITDLEELNRKLTFAGFYNMESLSGDYKEMKLNILNYVNTYLKELTK